MSNTGIKTVLTEKEVYEDTGIPTGQTRPNDPDQPYYIEPYEDLTACPITYDTSCPLIAATGHVGTVEYEFHVPNSTLRNPAINSFKLKLMQGGTEHNVVNWTRPFQTANLFTGTITGVAAGTYTVDMDWLNSGGTVIQICPNRGLQTNIYVS